MNPLALKEVSLKLRELRDQAKEKYIENDLMNHSETSKSYKEWKNNLKLKLTEIYNYAKNNNIPYKIDLEDFYEEVKNQIAIEVQDEYYEEYSEEISNDYDE